MSRATSPRAAASTRLLAVLGVALLLSACGEPPQPLPTAPPEHFGSAAPPSAAGYPSSPMTQPPPAYALPTFPTVAPSLVRPPITTTPTTPPAPKCTHGPTPAQVLAVVRAQPGIPSAVTLDVKAGPYCQSNWQFTVIGEAGKTLDQVDPLLVVTTGTPAALQVVEAGQDVCSDRVQNSAPPGIKVLACT